MTVNVDMLQRMKIKMYKRLETWLDLPAKVAISIKKLAANSGSTWISQAPNLYSAMQLVNKKIKTATS